MADQWVKIKLTDDLVPWSQGEEGWAKRNTERPSPHIKSWWMLHLDGTIHNVSEVLLTDIAKTIRKDGQPVHPTASVLKKIEKIFRGKLGQIKKLNTVQNWREYEYTSSIRVTFKGKDKQPHTLSKGQVWAARKLGGKIAIALKDLGLDTIFTVQSESFKRLESRSKKLSEILFG